MEKKEKFIQVGFTALRDPATRAFLPAVPLYIKADDSTESEVQQLNGGASETQGGAAMSSRSKKKAAHVPAAPVISTHIAFTDGYNKGYEDGLEKGFRESSHILIQRMYAAILIAESEINGSDQDKCMDFIHLCSCHARAHACVCVLM